MSDFARDREAIWVCHVPLSMTRTTTCITGSTCIYPIWLARRPTPHSTFRVGRLNHNAVGRSKSAIASQTSRPASESSLHLKLRLSSYPLFNPPCLYRCMSRVVSFVGLQRFMRWDTITMGPVSTSRQGQWQRQTAQCTSTGYMYSLLHCLQGARIQDQRGTCARACALLL